MPSFSERSLRRLETCHPDLQRLFHEVVKHVDCMVIFGFRTREEQEQAFEDGNSDKHWPDSLHNKTPSQAVDVAPYPVDWKNEDRFRAFGGFVLGVASQMGIPIRWGGDWDGDWDFSDQRLVDQPHFELRR